MVEFSYNLITGFTLTRKLPKLFETFKRLTCHIVTWFLWLVVSEWSHHLTKRDDLGDEKLTSLVTNHYGSEHCHWSAPPSLSKATWMGIVNSCHWSGQISSDSFPQLHRLLLHQPSSDQKPNPLQFLLHDQLGWSLLGVPHSSVVRHFLQLAQKFAVLSCDGYQRTGSGEVGDWSEWNGLGNNVGDPLGNPGLVLQQLLLVSLESLLVLLVVVWGGVGVRGLRLQGACQGDVDQGSRLNRAQRVDCCWGEQDVGSADGGDGTHA